MASCIYETFVVRVLEGNKLLGYASNSIHEDLDIVKHNDDGRLYDRYDDAYKAALVMSKTYPEFTFDVDIVLLDSEDMYAFCD